MSRSLVNMQQYFSDEPLSIGCRYNLNKDQSHHAGTVMKLDHETVRLVYDGIGYYGTIQKDKTGMYIEVKEVDLEEKELPIKVTLAIALIRREKLELVLQKATELGVDKIVLFESSRCVVHGQEERIDHQMNRWQTILRESAAQCKRNRIPKIYGIVSLQGLTAFQSDVNYVAYENADKESGYLSQNYHGENCTIAIGPEGGFSIPEIEQLEKNGFLRITLGHRILRAETASFYALSLIAEQAERKER